MDLPLPVFGSLASPLPVPSGVALAELRVASLRRAGLPPSPLLGSPASALSGAMAIGSEGVDLVAYMLLFIPLEFLMTSRRLNQDGNRNRAVARPMVLLVLFAGLKIGYELMHKEPSYYDMMEVMPNAPYSEIKKGYKRMSLKVHPDKVMSEGADDGEDASEAFRALKAAYDVLNDLQLRDVYNKFGPPGVENKDDTSGLLAGLGFFYVTWLAVAYLITQSKPVNRAQTWAFTGLLALGIFEYQVRHAPRSR